MQTKVKLMALLLLLLIPNNIQAVAGTPMAIMPSCSSTNLVILRPIQIKRYGLMHWRSKESLVDGCPYRSTDLSWPV